MSIKPIAFDALTRVLTGLHEYTIVAADDTPSRLVVRVIATATSAPCPSCGEFSTAVKAIREQSVRDVPHAGRVVALTVVKRSFRCTAEWCERKTFTQHY
jgi:transposase